MKLFGFLNSRSAKAVEENEMLPQIEAIEGTNDEDTSSICLLYTSPSPRD